MVITTYSLAFSMFFSFVSFSFFFFSFFFSQIQNGQVAEVGRHDELLERNGIYAKLVAKQLEGARATTTEQKTE